MSTNDLLQDMLAETLSRLAALTSVHARYFDLDGVPGEDDTTPEPEDVWRYDRDFRKALGLGRVMSTATSGRSREYKVRDHMTSFGWEPIFRAAASKGPADLGMAHEEHGLALVQVGTANKTLGPGDRARLLRAAWLCSALPIVANAAPRKDITYWRVIDGPPKTWGAWKP